MIAEILAKRTETTPFDVIVEGETPGSDPAKSREIIRTWQEAGATWWLEAKWSANGSEGHSEVVSRLRQGPPR